MVDKCNCYSQISVRSFIQFANLAGRIRETVLRYANVRACDAKFARQIKRDSCEHKALTPTIDAGHVKKWVDISSFISAPGRSRVLRFVGE